MNNLQTVIAAIESQPGVTLLDVYGLIRHVNQATVRSVISKAIRDGDVVRSSDGQLYTRDTAPADMNGPKPWARPNMRPGPAGRGVPRGVRRRGGEGGREGDAAAVSAAAVNGRQRHPCVPGRKAGALHR